MEKMSADGMKHLKAFLAFPISLGMTYDKAMADGSVGLTDLPLLIEPSMKLMGVIESTPHVLSSVKDLNDEDRAELVAWAKSEFDIADDTAEKKIEDCLKLVLDISAYVLSFVR